MKRVSAKHVTNVHQAELSMLYGPSSQRVRLEWVTSIGGTLNKPHNKYVGATETLHISNNVAGIWGPVMRDQRERVRMEGQAIDIDQLGFWYFDNSLSLAEKTNLLILHCLKDKYHSSNGTGSASVWTPDEDPEFTADEWISYWLVFSDRRFKITDNDTTTVTVDLTSGIPSSLQELPETSTAAEIMALIEWHPVRQKPELPGGALSPMGQETILQSVFCSRIPIVGR